MRGYKLVSGSYVAGEFVNGFFEGQKTGKVVPGVGGEGAEELGGGGRVERREREERMRGEDEGGWLSGEVDAIFPMPTYCL